MGQTTPKSRKSDPPQNRPNLIQDLKNVRGTVPESKYDCGKLQIQSFSEHQKLSKSVQYRQSYRISKIDTFSKNNSSEFQRFSKNRKSSKCQYFPKISKCTDFSILSVQYLLCPLIILHLSVGFKPSCHSFKSILTILVSCHLSDVMD